MKERKKEGHGEREREEERREEKAGPNFPNLTKALVFGANAQPAEGVRTEIRSRHVPVQMPKAKRRESTEYSTERTQD